MNEPPFDQQHDDEEQLACYAGDSSAHYAAHRDASDESVWSLGLNAWLRARPYRERAVTAGVYS